MSIPKIAVFYHCRLSGGSNVDNGVGVQPNWGMALFQKQLKALYTSGLIEASELVFIGVNGEWKNESYISAIEVIPSRKLQGVFYGQDSQSLIPTMRELQKWLPGHEDWLVMFHHSKGATHPNDHFCDAWRGCMERACVWNWRRCMADLQAGYDAVGCHWLRNSPNDPNEDRWGANSFFGGVFFWATAKYLLTLPQLPDAVTDRHSWYMPELWLGNGTPKVKDYHPAHPSLAGCMNWNRA